MSAYEHRWLPIPPVVVSNVSNQTSSAFLQDEIVALLNSADVGGAGWKFAGMLPDAILVVRELPPTGSLTVEQAMAAADAAAPAKSRKK